MRGRVRVAGTVVACAASAFLIGAAASAPAAGPAVVDYRAIGSARGLDVAFTFQGSLFERLVDLGVPAARSDLNSEAGGASSGSAAQLFPGDLLIGALGESIPGYRQAVFPATQADPKPVDEAYLPQAFQLPAPIQAGPLTMETGRLRATASENESSGLVTTNRLALGMETPLIEIRNLEAFSEGKRAVDHVTHVARSTASGITITVSKDLVISIGSVTSLAQTTSDGESPTVEASLTVKDVSVVMGGVTYQAAIDQSGIRLVGFPRQVPPAVPQNLNRNLGLLLDQANIQISTAGGTKRIEEVTGDASIGGLVVTVTGVVPNVFVPQIVAEVQAEIEKQLPPNLHQLLFQSTCYVDDIKPRLPKEFTDAFPDLPICVGPNAIPGPGSGVVTSFAIGSVRSTSIAVRGIDLEEPPIDVPVDGGFGPPLGPIDTGPIGGGGFTPGTNGGTGQPVGRPQLFGLVARLPAGALLGGGVVLLALALGMAMGPSLRSWRRVT
jgi:hypothetical protein